MKLRGKNGQRLMVGFEGTELTEGIIRLIEDYKLGNIILFARNVESAEQLRALCDDIQSRVQKSTGRPAIISIDQEGGVVNRLSDAFAAVAPGAMAVSATGNPHNAYLAGRITGQELRALGVNFNLAPDMDVNTNAHNPVIGVRSYGDKPETVSAYGCEAIKGLRDGGVLSCAKHFPGHGDTAVDSHVGLPVVDKSMKALEACELAPFRAAIEAGAPAIMTTHILFPQLERERVPATMSKAIITGLLRERMGYRGMIVSDCMMMGAIQDHYGTVAGSIAALKAGVDMVCVCHSAELAREVLDEMERFGELPGTDEAVARILACRDWLESVPAPDMSVVGCKESREIVRSIARDAITLVQAPEGGAAKLGDSPVFLGCAPYRPTEASNPEEAAETFPEHMRQRLGGEAVVTPTDPTDEEIARILPLIKGHSCAVLGTYNGHSKTGQLKLLSALADARVPVIAVALRNPYDLADLPRSVTAYAAYEYSKNALDAVADALSGRLTAKGALPVALS